MPAPKNTFKAAIRENRFQLGLWVALASPYAAEVVAGSGYDWLLIDGEHAPNDIPMLAAQYRAVAGGGSHPIVRLPVIHPAVIVPESNDHKSRQENPEQIKPDVVVPDGAEPIHHAPQRPFAFSSSISLTARSRSRASRISLFTAASSARSE